jgi:phage terminase small subunit
MAPATRQRPLSLRHERFLAEYAKDLNASAAMRRAGYSPATVRSNQAELVRRPEIARRITAIRQRYQARLDRTVTKASILEAIGRIALSDPRRLFDEDGKLKPINELDDETAAAVASFKTGKYGTDVRLWDKPKALELAARHLGLLEQQAGSGVTVIVNSPSSMAELDPALRARALTPDQPSNAAVLDVPVTAALDPAHKSNTP